MQGRLEEEFAAAAGFDAAVAACDAERAELARREASGDVDPVEAERLLAAIDARAAQARSAAAQRRRVAAALEERIESERVRQDARTVEQVLAVARRAQVAVETRREAVVGALATLAAVVHDLELARKDAPEVQSLAAWHESVPEIIGFLKRERDRAQFERDRAAMFDSAAGDEVVRYSVEQAARGVTRIAALPEDLRECARERRVELRREAEARRERVLGANARPRA